MRKAYGDGNKLLHYRKPIERSDEMEILVPVKGNLKNTNKNEELMISGFGPRPFVPIIPYAQQ